MTIIVSIFHSADSSENVNSNMDECMNSQLCILQAGSDGKQCIYLCNWFKEMEADTLTITQNGDLNFNLCEVIIN